MYILVTKWFSQKQKACFELEDALQPVNTLGETLTEYRDVFY